MRAISARLRAMWRAMRAGRRFEADMHDEMRFHIDMEAQRLVRERGLTPEEAMRRAHVAFGGVEKYKQDGRATQALHWVDALSLDVRLGLRMLIKHRALTLIGSFALAVAIAVGATTFEIITEAMYARLPVDEGDRVVTVQYQTETPGDPERRILGDFRIWRQQLTRLEQLGAFRTIEINLITGNAAPEPIFVAQITASGFAVARTPPLMGRYLLPEDEQPGAEAVIVIGYRAWQSRFGADPAIIGRSINLDADRHVVVGVMPDGFRFPVNHQFWAPLKATAREYDALEGPAVNVFGRLPRGVSFDEAQAELTMLGQRRAATAPQLYERKRPVLLPYTREFAEVDDPVIAWLMWIAQLLISGLVAVVGINVAILMYAQTMVRRSEIAMRTALGAGRRRILLQLFLEAFALCLLGAALGTVLAQVSLQQFLGVLIDSGATFIPYWIDLSLSWTTIGYAIAMAAVAAFIVGVLPGLKVTGAGLQASLRELGGGLTVRLGRTWTFLIVAQVAMAVAVLPIAIFVVWKVAEIEGGDVGFPIERYVVAEAAMNDSTGLQRRSEVLLDRLRREPGVVNVAFSSAVPGGASAYRRLDFDLSTGSGELASEALLRGVSVVQVGPGFLEQYHARLAAGRSFTGAEISGARPVIVDRTFVHMLMGTRPVLGQRFRYTTALDDDPATTPSEWFEIVGVVNDIPSYPIELGTERQATVYHLTAPGDMKTVIVNLEYGGAIPEDVIGRLRSAGAAVDPGLQLRNVMPLSEHYGRTKSFGRLAATALAVITASVLLLSAAGIYALLSFTVAQRTREIGIRSALGASPLRVVASVFGGVTRQVMTGLMVGSFIAGVFLAGTAMTRGEAVTMLLIVPGIVLLAGLAAAVGPTRRSLRMSTTDALRS